MNEDLNWIKSSYSGTPSTDCVELAFLDDTAVKVRDSKAAAGPQHTFKGTAWSAFIRAVRDQELGTQ
ncbi:DUF397 domain-containing protein [Streptomyces phaeochromogenes]|uniref:DUF397 domain-containing protein n=1 Tax=Streptomyces phaeochromogenes TaxID=1923 RepID=UPI002E298989|nr:DUF397 domain-containing protein [Streptomyces phaeochromogenes]